VGVLALAAWRWRDDIIRTTLDPKVPFQTYTPPPAADYARRDAWVLLPPRPETSTPGQPAVDVFFVHPTTYDGGRHWNAPVDDPEAGEVLERVMLPNYAAPYARVGRVFAPRYRQASLYAVMTLREDARDARRLAYDDVRRAFQHYVERYNQGRPVLLVGVEQGGTLAARLLAQEIAADAGLSARLVGAHLIETVTPEANPPVPACTSRAQARCVLAYAAVREGDARQARRLLERSLVWTGQDRLETLHGAPALCVNAVLGARTEAQAPARAHLGAANATGLEWGSRAGFMPRQVSTRCQGGVLYVSRPASPSLRPAGGWAERRRAPGYNLFYADLEADAAARVAALQAAGLPAPPMTGPPIPVRRVPVHRID
jgi:hypothetical protein